MSHFMRRYIALAEAAVSTVTAAPAAAAAPATPGTPPVGAAPQNPDVALSGDLDAVGLAKLLPDVSDSSLFVAALNQVKQGQVDQLSVAQRAQLSDAFLSLLQADPAAKRAILAKLLTVQAAPSAPAQGQNPVATPQDQNPVASPPA